ncbi:unnamed protein product [Cuscuta europaea]|uniref:Transposase (putative) gypsy type domain-containing protein n=1 Tax=Cuscuta europaea TaxID=41803 RepID=A0A9P0ZRD3_CUSEU|nr:unnamed protein product [Cuscuta europaea]
MSLLFFIVLTFLPQVSLMPSSSSVPLHTVFPDDGASSNRPKIPVDSREVETHFYLSADFALRVTTANISNSEFNEAVALSEPKVVCSRLTPSQNIVEPPLPSHFGVHLVSLQVGLRLTLHLALLDILHHYGVISGQHCPTTHLFIVGFIAQCISLKIKPYLDLFLIFFYSVRSSASDTQGYFSTPSGWATVCSLQNLIQTLSRVGDISGSWLPQQMASFRLRIGGGTDSEIGYADLARGERVGRQAYC